MSCNPGDVAQVALHEIDAGVKRSAVIAGDNQAFARTRLAHADERVSAPVGDEFSAQPVQRHAEYIRVELEPLGLRRRLRAVRVLEIGIGGIDPEPHGAFKFADARAHTAHVEAVFGERGFQIGVDSGRDLAIFDHLHFQSPLSARLPIMRHPKMTHGLQSKSAPAASKTPFPRWRLPG